MIHVLQSVLILLVVAPLTLFCVAFLVAFADWFYAQVFPSQLPAFFDDAY